MSRLPVLPVVLACLLVSTASLAQEPQQPRAVPEPAAAIQAVVQGLAATDLLNVRQEPGPLGRTQARLPVGTLVTRHECRAVDGYEWCRIDAVDPDDQRPVGGWTPARYLVALDVLDVEPLDVTQIAPDPEDAEAPGREARLVAPEDGEAPLPPGIEDRFAGGESLPVDEVRNGAGENGEQEPVAAAAAPEAPAANPVPAPGIPTPTPRPEPMTQAEAAADEPETPPAPETGPAPVAALPAEPASTPPAETLDSEIPCARYLGQPMARCAARVVRSGPDEATVIVTWPDGGARVLEFRDGEPAGSNGRGEFRFTREASLNLIRIGASERFEVLDALPFGD